MLAWGHPRLSRHPAEILTSHSVTQPTPYVRAWVGE